jgi:hypothetical protein
MKEKWKVIFLARKQEIFDVMNVSLKESLEIQSIMDLTDTKIDGILSIIIKVR